MLRSLIIGLMPVLLGLPALACDLGLSDRGEAVADYVEQVRPCFVSLPEGYTFDARMEREFLRLTNAARNGPCNCRARPSPGTPRRDRMLAPVRPRLITASAPARRQERPAVLPSSDQRYKASSLRRKLQKSSRGRGNLRGQVREGLRVCVCVCVCECM